MNGERNGDLGNTHFIHAPLRALAEHSNVVVAADWLADRPHLITASWDGTAMVFDTENGVCIDTLCGNDR